MDIAEEKQGSVVVVSLIGRTDGLSAPTLEQRLNEIVDRGDVNVLLDCAKMDYISSAGLRSFLIGARKCQQNNGKLAICALQDNCKAVMTESGFISIIDCYDTRAAALGVGF